MTITDRMLGSRPTCVNAHSPHPFGTCSRGLSSVRIAIESVCSWVRRAESSGQLACLLGHVFDRAVKAYRRVPTKRSTERPAEQARRGIARIRPKAGRSEVSRWALTGSNATSSLLGNTWIPANGQRSNQRARAAGVWLRMPTRWRRRTKQCRPGWESSRGSDELAVWTEDGAVRLVAGGPPKSSAPCQPISDRYIAYTRTGR